MTMFVAEDAPIPLPIVDARARLSAYLSQAGLQGPSDRAHDVAAELLLTAGVAGIAKGVVVQMREPYLHEGVTVVPFRWVATGASGALFPELDGNLELRPGTEDASVLSLLGAYRPPLAGLGRTLDRMLLHRVADATVRGFLRDIVTGLLAVSGEDRDTLVSDSR